eukprot:Gb_38763 [translate_table: standard]
MELSISPLPAICPRYRLYCPFGSPFTNSWSCSTSIFTRHGMRSKATRAFFSSHTAETFPNILGGSSGFRFNHFSTKHHGRTGNIIAETASPNKGESHTHREMYPLLPFQTLGNFPREELLGKVVMVRFDTKTCFRDDQVVIKCASQNTLNTFKYLCNAGAKVVLVSRWAPLQVSAGIPQIKTLADYLSVRLEKRVIVAQGVIGDKVEQSINELKNGEILLLGNLTQYKEEAANCVDFARSLSARIDILVNDAFSESHKVLASTVGVARFTYARIAGFDLAEKLSLFTETLEKPKRPFIAIIGGAKILEKTSALRSLLCKCDGLVVVGIMAFTFLYALGLPISPRLVEKHALGEALELMEIAKQRNVRVLLPKDFWCIDDTHSCEQMYVFKAQHILDGWKPVDIGPTTLNVIASFLGGSKTALWIGPVKLGASKHRCHGSSHLARLLGQISENGCITIAIGREACSSVREVSVSNSVHVLEHGAVVWELLKGNTLAGVAALDRAYAGTLDWRAIFSDPSQPLIVDIGSGNGLFVLKMAQMFGHLNFLGLEINKKLVDHSIACIQELGLRNGHFISTNATTTFRSITSSYPGSLLLVSIQCPNPNFNNPEHRWRMVQRSLVEAIVEMVFHEGKIFLQSDVKEVAVRMKDEFLQYGKGKVGVSIEHYGYKVCDTNGWLKDNPFGVCSDWEQHVIDRGEPMYRVVLSKNTNPDRMRSGDYNWKETVTCSKLLRLS